MSLDEEYTAYVSGRLPWLRGIAYPLCQDWHRADDLVQTAITRLYVKWRHARLADDLDAYVRVILIRVFLAEQRGGWFSRAGAEGVVLCNAWDSNGAGCGSFPPLDAKEFARTQGSTRGVLNAKQVRALNPDATAKQLRGLIARQERMNALGKVFFGIARAEVHGITVVTTDGREITGGVARSVGAGLGVWAVRFPSDVTEAALVFTDADGKTFQRVRHG